MLCILNKSLHCSPMSHTSIMFEEELSTTVTFLMQIFPCCKTFHTLRFPLNFITAHTRCACPTMYKHNPAYQSQNFLKL